jgi:hypothetical protein
MFNLWSRGLRGRLDDVHMKLVGVMVGCVSSYYAYNKVLTEFPPPPRKGTKAAPAPPSKN